ncbi:MAG TPA: hypothetical protein VHX86_09570 [Tepidisphaeraceae bacterium]|nr:hypothetical protein [Tepidisphaeraceae bacterium]
MKSSKRTYLVLLAAVAGLSLAATGPVFGQARVNTDGHVLDANNQVGSGGYNAPSAGTPVWTQYQNAIATDNVTGGAGFQGRSFDGVNLGVGYTDPFAFRGLLAGQGVDQFIAGSTGVPTMANPTASSNTLASAPQPFYGTANNSRPTGFQLSQNTPAYVPAKPQYQTPEDTRLGTIDFNQTPVLPKPDELLLPSQVDPTAAANPTPSPVFAASPLYGVRQWQFSANQMQSNTDQTLGQPSGVFGGQSPLQQGAGLPVINQTPDQSRLMELRQELNQQSQANPQGSQSAQTGTGARLLAPLRPGDATNTNPNEALQPLGAGTSQLASVNLAPQAGDVSTLQSTRQYLNNAPLPTPTQQSTQYAQLEQMMQKYNTTHPKTDEEANREFQQILRLRQQAAINTELGSNVLGGGPKTTNMPGPFGNVPGADNSQPGAPLMPAPATPSPSTANAPKPGFKTMPDLSNLSQDTGLPPASPQSVEINSFATGVKAKGLADLIANGESLVRQQKYDRAIATYNDAIQVAPNNPLILTARANAEIGGGYYAQAYTDLHNAIAQDPAVLIGQYDLQAHLGAQRLKAVSDDLKQIVHDSPKDSTHAFLYAYVLYNSHHVGSAAEWLNATDKRSGGQDPAVLQMKKYWNFDEESPAATTPKSSTESAPAAKPSTRPSAFVPNAKSR